MAHPREFTLALVAYVQVRLLALSDFRYDGQDSLQGSLFSFMGLQNIFSPIIRSENFQIFKKTVDFYF